MKRLVPLFAALAVVLMSAAPALAAEPTEVANGIRDDGVFVESGASTSNSEIGALVAAARNDGENLSIVVLSEEPVSGAVTFADAVANRVSGLVIVIAPESIGYAGTGAVYTVDDLEDALDAAFGNGGNDGDFARSIVESLTGEAVGGSDPASTPAGSGGGGLVVIAVIAIVVIGGFSFLRSRSNKQKTAAAQSRIDEARAEVQQRIDDVANDLLDMEGEVRTANNARADRFYNEAGGTYREVSEQLASANSPHDLIDLSNSLDVAIWQLDTAEAILDGTELPQRPDPRSLTPAQRPTAQVDTSRLPTTAQRRRSTRRSSYGASSSMMETLLQVGMAYAATRSSRRSTASRAGSGGLGGLFGGRGSGSQSSGTSAASRRSASPKSGTGGRVRGGRSRRRG